MNRKKEGIIGFGIIAAALTTAFIIFGARANDTDSMDNGNEAKNPTDNGNEVIKLHKALELGHKKISTIDLSILKHLSGVDAAVIDKRYREIAQGRLSVLPETTNDYAIAVASYITDIPAKVLMVHLSLQDIIRIKNYVIKETNSL